MSCHYIISYPSAFSLRPPQTVSLGRPKTELVQIYLEQQKKQLCDPTKQQQCDTVHVSLLSGLTLAEYITARSEHCLTKHVQPCNRCSRMLQVATTIHKEGYCTLSDAFSVVSPCVRYTAQHARSKLLQMPLACLRVDYRPGVSKCFLVEHHPSVNYENLTSLLRCIMERQQPKSSVPPLDKATVKSLLGLCQSDKERECIRYAVFKASGVSSTQARKQFGFENMVERSKRVEACIDHAKYIRKSLDELARSRERSVLMSLGIQPDSSDSSSVGESTDDEDDYYCNRLDQSQSKVGSLDWQDLLPKLSEIVRQSEFNWFEVVSRVEALVGINNSDEVITEMSSSIEKLQLGHKEQKLLHSSHQAFLADQKFNRIQKSRHADALNGCVVTDSESDDDPDLIERAKTPLDPSIQDLLLKRRAALKRQVQRLKAKRIQEQHFLRRRISRKVKGIVKDYPDIGQTVEDFVKSCNVGADAWRRTGVLTFDGNCNVKQKVTYERIRQHLQLHYNRHFSYGTIVQLCVARNRRRKSALRYKGVARVTTRRARRGFQIKYNPDCHWSCALYRGLDYIQFTDGKDILNVNRDDASGFRLDTLVTHKQYATPAVQGCDILTTYTDYVKKYPSTLQTTSYNYSKTKTTPEFCAGVVKAAPIFSKSPAQHAADFQMLQSQAKLKPVYVHPDTGNDKRIVCIRVDGASDEGPAHEEVQYWWALEHLQKERLATLVTARSSGSSYLNRVELQNGCLTRGHSNLFIPSTLAGSCTETVQINEDILKQSLELAIEVYIKHVDQSPCGESVIHLFRGADSSTDHHKTRDYLKIFLKGSKKSKEKLKQEHPQIYQEISEIWDLRQRHLMTGYSPQYIYYLLCCFSPGCIHPLCKRRLGATCRSELSWFPGGPPLTYLPIPIPDPERPWGNNSCKQCSGFCSGHFLVPEVALSSDAIPMTMPPSAVIQQAFKQAFKDSETQGDISELAKKTLLPVDEVKIWVSHLEMVDANRRRGAKKAAATRRKSRSCSRSELTEPVVATYFCSKCGDAYEEETDEVQNWIACDSCNEWFHWDCVGIVREPQNFLCNACVCV